MTELTCIGCPRGCRLEVEAEGDGFRVTGNHCARGRSFAVTEMTAPMRTVCSTVRTAFPGVPVLPVRTSQDIPKERIADVMAALRDVTVTERIGRGSVILPQVLGLGADVIATSDVLLETAEDAPETLL